jgi:hypothetical protein
MVILFLIPVVLIVLMIASMWTIFSKAGKPGWACIVPIYNYIVLLEVSRKPLWWIILLLIPVVNFIVLIIVFHNLSLSFGKGGGFTAGLIFLPVIFFPILAFGDAKYVETSSQQIN